ncbi:restriction endonuclease subunit S [Avibacterium avium]|uniref:restriction endonuclease subunit S n=1 Tax=Avibacterium avium TaxID=751 RepID=UPI003BF81427
MKTNTFLEKLLQGAPVEWKTLGEVCEIKTGQSINKQIISNNPGIYPVINSGKEPLGYINKWNTEDNPIGVTTRGAGVGSITWQEGKYFRGNLNYAVTIKDKAILDVKFLYHTLLEFQQEIHNLCVFTGIPALNASELKTLEIPIPPLSIQKEIARILDAFTAITSELTSELTLRQKQYEYYRDKLLTFGDEVEWKPLGEVAKIKHGKDWKKLEKGDIPVYGSGGIMGYVNQYAYNKPTVLIPRKGSITNIFYVDNPFWNVDTIYYTEIDDSQIYPKFFYYFLKTIDFMKLDTGSGRPSLTQAILNQILIPIPPLEEQKRITAILDKFHTLTSSLSDGLPKEIELRQKQYEYYRDLLLNFKQDEARFCMA